MTDGELERRVRDLEREQASISKDIAWMRENLTTARTQHNWNIGVVVSILLGGLALLAALAKR